MSGSGSNPWYHAYAALLESRTGIVFRPKQIERVEATVRARAREVGAANVDAYIAWLDGPRGAEELQKLINLVTINKTSFFRSPDHVAAIVEVLVPALHSRLPSGRPIRIWSAACSSGEEPYSLAMALHAAGWPNRRGIEILGSDVSTAALAKAKAARYFLDERTLEAIPLGYRHYLSRNGDAFVVDSAARALVEFKHVNLLQLAAAGLTGPFDVVLCCNVLIYFGPATRARVVAALERHTSAESVLVFGAGEVVTEPSLKFRVARVHDAFIHVRGDWVPNLGPTPPRDAIAALKSNPIPTLTSPASSFKSSNPAELRVRKTPLPNLAAPKTVPSNARSPNPSSGMAPRVVQSQTTSKPVPVSTRDEREVITPSMICRQAKSQIEAGDLSSAIRLLESAPGALAEDPSIKQLLARVLLDSGRFEQALAVVEGALREEPFAPELHFVLGMAFAAREAWSDAEVAFRRAVFLDPGFALAHFELARSCHATGHFERAKAAYDRALRALDEPSDGAPRPDRSELSGMSPELLRFLCGDLLVRASRRESLTRSTRFSRRDAS